MKILTWLNAIEYIKANDNGAEQIISTLRQRFTKPYGFSVPGKRSTPQDLENWQAWLECTPLPLMTRDDWLESGNRVLATSNMTSTQQRHQRCQYLKFVKNLERMGYLLLLTPPEPESVKSRKKNKGEKPLRRRKPEWALEPVDDELDRADKKSSNDEIILKLTAEFYLPFYRERYPEKTDEELLTIIQKELDRIQADLNKFRHYLGTRSKGRQRDETQNINLIKIRTLLGWVFKQTQDLAEVSLTKLVPVVDIRIARHEFTDPLAYFLKKESLEEEIEAASEYVTDFLLEYFENYNPNYRSRSKTMYITALINLTKYLYQKINRKTKYPDFQDIPIIKGLQLLRSNFSDDGPKMKTIPVTLDVLVKYLDYFKMDLDYPYNEAICNGYLIKVKRDIRSIAHDMQRFLMVCFLVLVHPLRRRSLAQLQWGKTLVKGIKTAEGNFIPQDKMADPSQALYYYDMLPEEYKTGDTYGRYCVALPNHRFQDGTYFYDYLEKYLFGGYRQALLRHGQDHQYLFVRINDIKKWNSRAGDPIPLASYSDVVARLTKKLVGKAISPKQFRTIYRTYYVNLGAPPNVLEGLAYCMQHSPETAAKDYTWQTVTEKVAPFIKFFEDHFC